MAMSSNIQLTWEKIISEYICNIDNYDKNLNPPATEEEVSFIESKMGLTLPLELKELYKCNNGDSGKFIVGSILGLEFLSLKSVLGQWNMWNHVIANWKESSMETGKNYPEGHIKCLYANKLWIPFAHDSSGNHIGIDLDPDVNGKIGQVINFGRDEDDKYVIANNLQEFLDYMYQIITSDDFELEEFDDEKVFVLDGYEHAIDYLKSKFK